MRNKPTLFYLMAVLVLYVIQCVTTAATKTNDFALESNIFTVQLNECKEMAVASVHLLRHSLSH